MYLHWPPGWWDKSPGPWPLPTFTRPWARVSTINQAINHSVAHYGPSACGFENKNTNLGPRPTGLKFELFTLAPRPFFKINQISTLALHLFTSPHASDPQTLIRNQRLQLELKGRYLMIQCRAGGQRAPGSPSLKIICTTADVKVVPVWHKPKYIKPFFRIVRQHQRKSQTRT